jgi:hypothetical protein
MPIRINLLSEALAAEEMRRRDPVKRVAFIGGLLVALSLVWFSSAWLEGKMAQNAKTQVESEIHSNTNGFARVQADLKRVADCQKRLNALQHLSASRFLQGNLLNALEQVYVPNVQLIRMKLEQSCTCIEAVPNKTDDYGKLIPGRPASSTEHTKLILDAKDTSPNPGDGVNRYKAALSQQDYFKSGLNQTNGVRLINTSGTQTAVNGKPFILFVLECRYPDKTR